MPAAGLQRERGGKGEGHGSGVPASCPLERRLLRKRAPAAGGGGPQGGGGAPTWGPLARCSPHACAPARTQIFGAKLLLSDPTKGELARSWLSAAPLSWRAAHADRA